MKKILVACGSGIVTSTTVLTKLKALLDNNGFSGQYRINQIKVTEAAGKSDSADFLIATTVKPENLKCEFVSGIPFLTGMNLKETEDKIIELMKK